MNARDTKYGSARPKSRQTPNVHGTDTKEFPIPRENYKTDNGNLILDCHGLVLLDPPTVEAELNNIAGVVTNGIFARRPADVLLLGAQEGGQNDHAEVKVRGRKLRPACWRLR